MLQPEKIQAYLTHISENRLSVEDTLKRNIFKYSLWLLGLPAIIYGAADRGVAAFSKPVIEATDISYCLIALIILLGWMFMGAMEDSQGPPLAAGTEWTNPTALRFNSQCIAQQSYRLPFPYICQIYHLLNLKHLEEIHRFSLGNLKVIKVSHVHHTQAGGEIRFQTVLDSPFNILRMWRHPSVDVDLTIHAPHQIELKVPVYRQKFIHVLFNVFPINASEHQLHIQMFSDLQWPRELLRTILLLASSLTLLEDLPYLSQLARRNIASSSHRSESKISSPAMQLFQRYVELYGGYWEQKQLQPSD